MGWCSGTEVFDAVASALLEPNMDKESALKEIIGTLENMDWDCQSESAYWDDPLVRKVFKEIHPNWFEDGE